MACYPPGTYLDEARVTVKNKSKTNITVTLISEKDEFSPASSTINAGASRNFKTVSKTGPGIGISFYVEIENYDNKKYGSGQYGSTVTVIITDNDLF